LSTFIDTPYPILFKGGFLLGVAGGYEIAGSWDNIRVDSHAISRSEIRQHRVSLDLQEDCPRRGVVITVLYIESITWGIGVRNLFK